MVFFGIIALIGIFLSKQVAAPFGGVYKWLFENFPGFNSFREASKFYFLTALGYSVLIGVFTAWLWENWNGKKWHIYGKYLLIFLISFIFLWNTKPIITGEVGSMFVPRHIPNDYLILKDFILKQDGFFRTFWTPTAPRWGVYTNQKPKIINIVVIRNEWKDYVPLNSGYNNLSINKQITEIFKIKRAFDNSSIKYVVVPIDDISNDSDPFFYYGREKNPDIRNWYISELNKVGWLKKIDIGTKELVVYENENYKPHIYSSTTPTIIAGDIEALILLTETKYLDGKSVLLFTGGKRKEDANEEIVVVKKGKEEPEITFKKINPTKYLVKVEGAKAPFWLVFSESFHKQWRLYNKEKVEKKEDGVFEEIVADYPKLKVKEAKHLIKFTPKDIKCLFRKPLNAKHQVVNGYANGWYVEPRELELGEDFTLIMYFWPQSLFYLGLGISGLTLLFCIGYLGFSFVKRKKGKIASLSVRNDKKGVLDETKN